MWFVVAYLSSAAAVDCYTSSPVGVATHTARSAAADARTTSTSQHESSTTTPATGGTTSHWFTDI